ncbi:MAG: hypothetical protein VXB01_06225, partial [Opitutae bacterium]
ETSERLELHGIAKIIHNPATKIEASEDFEASVAMTYGKHDLDGCTISFQMELKAAEYTATSDDSAVGSLSTTTEGLYAYFTRFEDGTYDLYWSYKNNANVVSGSDFNLSGDPSKLEIRRVSNTLAVYVDNVKHANSENTHADWGTISGVRFSVSSGGSRMIGVNDFYLQHVAMATSGNGLDYLGDSTRVISSTLRQKEMRASLRNKMIQHEESQVSVTPIDSDFNSAFQVDHKAYVDGVHVQTIEASPYDGDMQFEWLAPGLHRLQNEFIIKGSGWRLTDITTICTVQDKKSLHAGPFNTPDPSYQATTDSDHQAELAGAGQLKHWLTRPETVKDLVAGSGVPDPSNPTFWPSPDGKLYALRISLRNITWAKQYTGQNFTIMVWTETNMNATVVKLRHDSDIEFVVTDENNIDVKQNGSSLGPFSLTPSTLSYTWNFWAITSDMKIYRNGVEVVDQSVVSWPTGSSTTLEINPNKTGSFIFYDFRLYSTVLSAEAIAYHYDQIKNHSGDKVLPLA